MVDVGRVVDPEEVLLCRFLRGEKIKLGKKAFFFKTSHGVLRFVADQGMVCSQVVFVIVLMVDDRMVLHRGLGNQRGLKKITLTNPPTEMKKMRGLDGEGNANVEG